MTSASLTLLKAFLRSIKHKYAGWLKSMDFSTIWGIIKIASVVERFFRKPCCSSLGCIYFRSLLRITLVNNF